MKFAKVFRADVPDKAIDMEVLEKSDKRLKVILPEIKETLLLSRTDVNAPYVGHKYNMEFICKI